MADDTENHTIRLLQEMRAETKAQFADMRAETKAQFESVNMRLDGMEKRLDGMDKRLDGIDKRLDASDGLMKVLVDAVTKIALIQEQHGKVLIELVEQGRNYGARLNAMDGRLGIIEKKVRLVDA